MTARRVLIVANEAVADRPAGVPESVRRQVLEAEQVRVIAPTLTTRLQSWTSDIDAPAGSAGERMSAIVESIHTAGQRSSSGNVGDEDPLQAIADALAVFPADALILAVRTPPNRRERRLGERAHSRFGLPLTEMLIDRDGRVVAVTTFNGEGAER